MTMVVESSTSTNNQNGSHDAVDESLALDRLLEVSTVVLRQAIELVENSLSSDEQLSAPSKYIPGSTIGKHLRHARDHFVLLLDSVSSPAPHTLNYDIRLRNTPMETVRTAALDSFKEAISRLEEIVPNVALDEPITLHAVTPFPQVVQTTFGRELWFAALHAVHHWSMLRVIAGELGITVEESLGFAPSTLVYQGVEAPLGKSRI